MPERLSGEEIAELSRLLKAATPGPWRIDRNHAGSPIGVCSPSQMRWDTDLFCIPCSDQGCDDAEANGSLIATAVNALPALLAELVERRAADEAALKVEPLTITVCDNCLRACCWQGEFMCSDAKHAGTKFIPRAEIEAMALENPRYWGNSDA